MVMEAVKNPDRSQWRSGSSWQARLSRASPKSGQVVLYFVFEKSKMVALEK